VWLARDIIGSYHAAKIVHRRDFGDVAPFEREFNGMRRFTPISRGHPGLVHVLHVGRNEDPEYIFYIMELGDDEVSGQNIDAQTYSARNLAKELKTRKGLPLSECIQMCLQLADSLAYLHQQGLIHRDIKPSNIIFVKGVPKLADIGLVTQAAAEGRDVSYLGTEGYIPPEDPGTPLADIYSLGKVIYEAATGMGVRRFPELPTTLMQGDAIPVWLQLNKTILKACEDDPKVRYQSAEELHSALLALHENVQNSTASKPL
jgi:eukaryotic-like serine/threonine-protein kinase